MLDLLEAARNLAQGTSEIEDKNLSELVLDSDCEQVWEYLSAFWSRTLSTFGSTVFGSWFLQRRGAGPSSRSVLYQSKTRE